MYQSEISQLGGVNLFSVDFKWFAVDHFFVFDFLECIHTRTVLTTRYALWISLFPLQHHSGFGYTVSFIFNVICFAWAEHVHKPFIWFECIFFYVYITLLCFICVFCHANIVWKNRGMKGEIKVNKTLQVQTLVSIFWDVVAATTTAASASRMQEFKKKYWIHFCSS